MTSRLLLCLLLCAAPAALAAQDAAISPMFQSTRAELTAAVAFWDGMGSSSTSLPEMKSFARGEAGLIRERLSEGDFRVGDQVALTVEGETALTATFTVGSGRVLQLPNVGDVPLAGVLRSELTPHVRKHVARFIREPVVRTRSLVRIAVTGQVRNPGYYVLPAESLISDALMAAGGPLNSAKLRSARIERASQRIWHGRPLRDAIAAGRTLDQMSLRAGDEIVVPSASGGVGSATRYLTTVPAALLAVLGVVRAL